MVEAALTYAHASELVHFLHQNGRTAYLTRGSDHKMPGQYNLTRDLRERTARSQQVLEDEGRLDLFLSLHCNAAGNIEGHGTEVWINDDESALVADQLAIVIRNKLGRSLRTDEGNTPGVKRAAYGKDVQPDYYFFRTAAAQQMCLELAFVTNPDDYVSLCGSVTQYAEAIGTELLLVLPPEAVILVDAGHGTLTGGYDPGASPSEEAEASWMQAEAYGAITSGNVDERLPHVGHPGYTDYLRKQIQELGAKLEAAEGEVYAVRKGDFYANRLKHHMEHWFRQALADGDFPYESELDAGRTLGTDAFIQQYVVDKAKEDMVKAYSEDWER